MSDPGPTSLTFEPLFAATGAVAAVIYARAARRHHPGALRVASFTAGLLLIVVALNSPWRRWPSITCCWRTSSRTP